MLTCYFTYPYCYYFSPVNLSPFENTGFLIQAKTSSDEFNIASPIWGEWIIPIQNTLSRVLKCRRSNVTNDTTLYEVTSLASCVWYQLHLQYEVNNIPSHHLR